MDNHDELIAQFVEISGADEDTARFYMQSSDWRLEIALANFLGTQADDEDEDAEPATAAAAKDVAATSAADIKPPPPARSEKFVATNNRPRIATLSDMARRSPQDDDEGQAFYAGGSDRSGQQILGPPRDKKSFREQLTEMFRMAHERSLEDDDQPMPSTSASAPVWGQGMRLGHTEDDHAAVNDGPGAAGAATGGVRKPPIIIKLWSKGFSINDSELRPYDDPDNKEFLATVMRGELPPELVAMGGMVNVDVEDHRSEEFVKKKVVVKTFKGSGHTLGSPTPNIVTNSAPVAPAPVATVSSDSDIANHEQAAKEALATDTAQPTTSIQIRLADGSRMTGQFNLSHTVQDIRQYIQNARPQYREPNFILVSSFPTRELTDLEATIEQAGLKNAAIMQRLK